MPTQNTETEHDGGYAEYEKRLKTITQTGEDHEQALMTESRRAIDFARRERRQVRLEAFACAALPTTHAVGCDSPEARVKLIFDIAELMVAESDRRMAQS